MSNDKLGTAIHGIGAHESLDSSGERILINGIDISSLTHDGLVNWEHKAESSDQIIGKIIEATKILKKDDCKNKHHEYFWEKAGKMPYLYIKAVMFDGFGHNGAQSAVAMLKFDKELNKEDTKQTVGFSVEGSKLDKEGALIKKCIARKISFTNLPCNKACIAEILEADSEEKPRLISLSDLKLAFKKAEDMENDMKKADKKYLTQLAGKLTPKEPSKKQTYTKITSTTGEHKEATPAEPKQTIPHTEAPKKITPGTKIEYRKQKMRTGASIYKDPETWKTESNVRKQLTKKPVSKNMTAPTTKTKINMSEKDMAKAKKEILKSMSDEAFDLFKNKDLLIDIAKSKMPEASEEEVLAFAKTYAYIQLKKSEIGLEKLANEIEGSDIEKANRSDKHREEQIKAGKRSKWEAKYKPPRGPEKGVHNKAKGLSSEKHGGTSEAGAYVKGNKAKARDYDFNPEKRSVQIDEARKEHHKVIREQKEMKAPNLPKSEEMQKANPNPEKPKANHPWRKQKFGSQAPKISIDKDKLPNKEPSAKKDKSPDSDEAKELKFNEQSCVTDIKPDLKKPKMEKKGRCWDGYEPTPGKKAFSQGSCKPVKKAEVPSNEIHLYKYEDGTAEIVWGEAVLDKTVDIIIKSELDGWQENHEDIEKKEKPFHGYNPEKHSKEGGLNDKAREKYNRETGSDLKRPVTGKVKAGSKSANRRKSFCARMSGVKGPTSKEGKLTPKGASLKRWKC
jgi:hypothetical protein